MSDIVGPTETSIVQATAYLQDGVTKVSQNYPMTHAKGIQSAPAKRLWTTCL